MTPPKGPEDKDPDLSKKGAQVAVGRRCASCHTDSFAGTKAVARLAGQREEYLVKALHDYKTSQRVGGGGAAMADVAYHMSDEEITAVAHYLAYLQVARRLLRPSAARRPGAREARARDP